MCGRKVDISHNNNNNNNNNHNNSHSLDLPKQQHQKMSTSTKAMEVKIIGNPVWDPSQQEVLRAPIGKSI